MVYNNVLLKVKDIENISLVGDLLKEQARRSSEEPGCIRFEVYHSQSDSQQFILVEQWANEEDLERHKSGKNKMQCTWIRTQTACREKTTEIFHFRA